MERLIRFQKLWYQGGRSLKILPMWKEWAQSVCTIWDKLDYYIRNFLNQYMLKRRARNIQRNQTNERKELGWLTTMICTSDKWIKMPFSMIGKTKKPSYFELIIPGKTLHYYIQVKRMYGLLKKQLHCRLIKCYGHSICSIMEMFVLFLC